MRVRGMLNPGSRGTGAPLPPSPGSPIFPPPAFPACPPRAHTPTHPPLPVLAVRFVRPRGAAGCPEGGPSPEPKALPPTPSRRAGRSCGQGAEAQRAQGLRGSGRSHPPRRLLRGSGGPPQVGLQPGSRSWRPGCHRADEPRRLLLQSWHRALHPPQPGWDVPVRPAPWGSSCHRHLSPRLLPALSGGSSFPPRPSP